MWYVVLRERNLLATQQAEARRIGANEQTLGLWAKAFRVCVRYLSSILTYMHLFLLYLHPRWVHASTYASIPYHPTVMTFPPLVSLFAYPPCL